MKKTSIEVLSPFGLDEAVQRMKIEGLQTELSDQFEFSPIGKNNSAPDCLLINGIVIDFNQSPGLEPLLQDRARKSVIMIFLPDLYPQTVDRLRMWSQFADVFLVATPELANQVRALTQKEACVLSDPIDFGLKSSFRKAATSKQPRVLWFGYPESYQKSMAVFETSLIKLHLSKKIDYHIITRANAYGSNRFGITIAPYNHLTFKTVLESFDICVTSHVPLDFSMSTFWKSENKAVLAINRGVATIASHTPAYQRLFIACGLEDYLFDSADDLTIAINRLLEPQERDAYLERSQDYVLENYSIKTIAAQWLQIFQKVKALKFKEPDATSS